MLSQQAILGEIETLLQSDQTDADPAAHLTRACHGPWASDSIQIDVSYPVSNKSSKVMLQRSEASEGARGTRVRMQLAFSNH